MFWLGLLLAICYIPGITGAAIPTQWAVLSIVLPFGLWRKGNVTLIHKLLAGLIVYALVSLAWTQNIYSAGWGLWFLFIWALAYNWGTLMTSTRRMWHGLSVGLSIGSLVALAQALDIGLVEIADPNKPAGLLFNSSLFGVCLGLVIVGCICHRLWWYLPILSLGLILSGSRGGMLLVAIGLIVIHIHWVIAVGFGIACALTLIFTVDPADSQRLQIWGVTLNALSLFGHGPGSFTDLHYITRAKSLLIRPEYVHNDYLQLIYEFGIAAILPIGAFGLALVRRRSADWPVLFAFAVLATFYFPLYTPITAFIGFVVAGHCTRDWPLVWNVMYRWGRPLFSWPSEPRTLADRSQAIPLVS